MNTAESSGMVSTEIKEFAKTLSVDSSLLGPLSEFIIKRGVPTSQISTLLRSSIGRIANIRDILNELYEQSSKGDQIRAHFKEMATLIETDGERTFSDLELRLEEIVQSAGTPSEFAKVQTCCALLHASKQDHLPGANLCEQAETKENLTASEKWNLLHLQATLLSDYGRDFFNDDSLQKSVELIKDRVLPLAEETEVKILRVQSFQTLGDALGIRGQRKSGPRYLEEAIDAFKQARDLCDVESSPSEWATAQNALGNALGLLGQRTADEELLQQSVEAFEQALTKRDEESTPDEWASTMNNFAAVSLSLGSKKKDAKILKRASESYKAVLRVWTRSQSPERWGTTMDNLGTSLRHLGEHRRGPRTLMQAVAAYNSALSERPQDRFPVEWAKTHNNLGAALQKLAQREEDPKLMNDATESYENALQEQKFEKAPMTWAMATANLGVARRELALMTGDVSIASKAVDEIQSAIDVFRSASHAQFTELGEEQLATAKKLRDSLMMSDHLEN